MNKIVEASKNYIENNLDVKITVTDIALEIAYSADHLSKLFKHHTGITIHNYIRDRKLVAASKSILSGSKIIDAAMTFGYDTQTGFNKAYKKKFGFSPKMLHLMRLAQEIFSNKGEVIMDYKTLYLNILQDLKARDMDTALFELAYYFVLESLDGKLRYSGEPYIVHQLSVVSLLEKMELPMETILLGLLHESLNDLSEDIIKTHFGVNTLNQLKKLCEIEFVDGEFQGIINDTDEDLLIIKLTDRLHNMKTLSHVSKEKWQVKAKETVEYFIPIAKSLNLEMLRLELEDLSLQYLI